VLADVGITAGGGINWQAPVIGAWGVEHLPWYVVVGEDGAVRATGHAAHAIVDPLMAR
jgi:hypothetical protein